MLQTGLYSRYTKNMVLGLPSDIINGKIAQIKSAWRGAFLANGRLSDPARPAILKSCARTMSRSGTGLHRTTLGITAKPRKLRSSERVTLRDPDAIERMLILMGAPRSAREWTGKRSDGEARGKANRLANFDDANMRRSAKAAAEACDKVRQALRFLEMTFQTTSNRPASFVSTMLMRRWNSWDVGRSTNHQGCHPRAASVDFCSSPRKPKKRAASRLD